MSRKIADAGTSCMLGLGALLTASGVLAQPAAGVAPTTTHQVAAPALEYVSPISTYKSYEPQSIQSWKEANDNVGRLGGWRAYSRETSQGQTTPAAAATSADSTAHSNHHVEKK